MLPSLCHQERLGWGFLGCFLAVVVGLDFVQGSLVDLLKFLGGQQLINVQQDHQSVIRFGEPRDVACPITRDGFWSILDILFGDPHDLSDHIDGASHRPVADIDHNGSRFRIGRSRLQPKERAKIDNGNDRSAKVADTLDKSRHLGRLGDLIQNDDFLNLLDSKSVFLTIQQETNKLRQVLFWVVRFRRR